MGIFESTEEVVAAANRDFFSITWRTNYFNAGFGISAIYIRDFLKYKRLRKIPLCL